MPRLKTETVKAADPVITHIAETEEGLAKQKTSPEVEGDQAQESTSERTNNSPEVGHDVPEGLSPAEPTTSLLPDPSPNEIKPLFYLEQPKDRVVPCLAPEDYQALKANIEELG